MSIVLTSRPSKPSKLKRLSFLPRIGITVDFAGHQFGYFQVPLIENFVNLVGRGFTVENIIENAHQQIRELEILVTVPKKAERTKPLRKAKSKVTATKRRK